MRVICRGVAAYARSRSRCTGCTWRSPRSVLTKIGREDDDRDDEPPRAWSTSVPNIVLSTGASATIGITERAAAVGDISESTIRLRAATIAASTAAVPPTSSPTSTFSPVARRRGPHQRDDLPELVDDRRRAGQQVRLDAGGDDEHLPERERDEPEQDGREPADRRAAAGSGGRCRHRVPRRSVVRVIAGPPRARCRRPVGMAPLPCSASRTAVTAAKNEASSRSPSVRSSPIGTGTTAVIRPGSRRHDDDPLRQEHRLGDRVRDEHDRRAALPADPHELGLHPLARHLVERAERLVHEQQARPLGERPGDRHALLHAAGELVREVPGEVVEADEREQLGRPRRALRLAHAVQLQRELDVARDVAPRQQPGLLERDAVVLRLAGRLRRLAEHPQLARGRLVEVADRAAAASTCRSRTGRSARRTPPPPTVRSIPSSAVDLAAHGTRSVLPMPRATTAGAGPAAAVPAVPTSSVLM